MLGYQRPNCSCNSPFRTTVRGEHLNDCPTDFYALVSELIDSYLLWCRENNEEETEPAARRRVGSTMVKMGLDSSGRRGRGIGIVYELPSVNELRVRFAQMIGMGVNDVF
ncbi:hypothetical protein [Xenorhabdus anantnagensis]|uniref:Uncharacterized protein n=1 Tax=Xenorhabdus anantnagensis TaxID=3025875 RepID=A0ABT5LQQ7_9GAMM|nr:hypothetical protein [Xenorhabdus anantnagensis]MDC9596183.1 hypothetical protein [Xenorhabdus anantnagensis]